MIQSNSRLGLSDRLDVHLDHVSMLAGNGRFITTGQSLDVMSAINRSIDTVKADIKYSAMHFLFLWLVLMMTQSTNH